MEVSFRRGQGLGSGFSLIVFGLIISGLIVFWLIVFRLIRRCGRSGLRRRFHELLTAFQIALNSLFGIADGTRQLDLSEIVRVKTLNVAFMSAG